MSEAISFEQFIGEFDEVGSEGSVYYEIETGSMAISCYVKKDNILIGKSIYDGQFMIIDGSNGEERFIRITGIDIIEKEIDDEGNSVFIFKDCKGMEIIQFVFSETF